MNHRNVRAAGLLTSLLALTATTIATLPAEAVPQDACSGEFCATVDLTPYDALAPTQPTTTAGQPTNLALRFTDTSAAVATNKATWLAKVWAVLGSSSTNAFAVTDPATLPLGAYVAGSAATAGACAPGMDGSGYAASCPAGSGSGYGELVPVVGSPEIKPATFGIQSITVGAGGAMTANVSIYVPGVTVLPLATTAPVTYAGATASAGPSLNMDVRFSAAPVGLYASGEFSMNTVALNLNGLVTEAAAGAVSPTSFVRQPMLCTSVTTTLRANARGPQSVSAPFAQTVTGCPVPPTIAEVAPVAGQPTAFTFATVPPVAAVPGRTASLEWVFGDGTKTVTGHTTTHAYPVAEPVTAFVSTVDSAGARSPAVAVPIAAGALRGKQKEGHLITGELTDQATDAGLGGQQVRAYRCATRHTTPIPKCDEIGHTTTRSSGRYRLRIPEVKKDGFVVVYHAGNGTTSADERARFGTRRTIGVLPQPRVTLKVSKKEIRPGGTVLLTGTVDPGRKGKTVRLQGFLRGKWRSVGKATISQRGTYAASYVVQVGGQDKLKLRARVDGTARTLQATSKVRVIRIAG